MVVRFEEGDVTDQWAVVHRREESERRLRRVLGGMGGGRDIALGSVGIGSTVSELDRAHAGRQSEVVRELGF